MAYPQRLLGQGERIEVEMRPHWKVLFVPVVLLLVVVTVASYLAAVLGDALSGWARWVEVAIAAVVLVVWVLVPFARWFTTLYVFTNRRIIVRSGLLTRRGKDMPLSKVNNVSFEMSLLERMLNAGTLIVESGAESGGLRIAHVRDVEDVQREIYRLHEEDDAWRRRDRDGDPWNDSGVNDTRVNDTRADDPRESSSPRTGWPQDAPRRSTGPL